MMIFGVCFVCGNKRLSYFMYVNIDRQILANLRIILYREYNKCDVGRPVICIRTKCSDCGTQSRLQRLRISLPIEFM